MSVRGESVEKRHRDLTEKKFQPDSERELTDVLNKNVQLGAMTRSKCILTVRAEGNCIRPRSLPIVSVVPFHKNKLPLDKQL